MVSNGTLFGDVSIYTCTGTRRIIDGRRVINSMCREDWRWSEQTFTCQGEKNLTKLNTMLLGASA